jgi:hypothetical protein
VKAAGGSFSNVKKCFVALFTGTNGASPSATYWTTQEVLTGTATRGTGAAINIQTNRLRSVCLIGTGTGYQGWRAKYANLLTLPTVDGQSIAFNIYAPYANPYPGLDIKFFLTSAQPSNTTSEFGTTADGVFLALGNNGNSVGYLENHTTNANTGFVTVTANASGNKHRVVVTKNGTGYDVNWYCDGTLKGTRTGCTFNSASQVYFWASALNNTAAFSTGNIDNLCVIE